MAFLQTFAPSKQGTFCATPERIERCYTGSAPSLAVMRQAYGTQVAETWLMCQLKDLGEYAGVKDKQVLQQIESTAQIILADCPWLKATELMHFFVRLKAGYYGSFFGTVDGMRIMQALQSFKKERRDLLARYERDAEERERKALAQEYVERYGDAQQAYAQHLADCQQRGVTPSALTQSIASETGANSKTAPQTPQKPL